MVHISQYLDSNGDETTNKDIDFKTYRFHIGLVETCDFVNDPFDEYRLSFDSGVITHGVDSEYFELELFEDEIEMLDSIMVTNKSVITLIELIAESDISLRWEIMCALEEYITTSTEALIALNKKVTLVNRTKSAMN